MDTRSHRPAPARSRAATTTNRPPRPPRGLKTRRAILRKAVNIASLEGLEGLTIGKLASTMRISKSGLFAHFGSKEDLQCAVVDEARDIFVEKVVRPAAQLRGLRLLRASLRKLAFLRRKEDLPRRLLFLRRFARIRRSPRPRPRSHHHPHEKMAGKSGTRRPRRAIRRRNPQRCGRPPARVRNSSPGHGRKLEFASLPRSIRFSLGQSCDSPAH